MKQQSVIQRWLTSPVSPAMLVAAEDQGKSARERSNIDGHSRTCPFGDRKLIMAWNIGWAKAHVPTLSREEAVRILRDMPEIKQEDFCIMPDMDDTSKAE